MRRRPPTKSKSKSPPERRIPVHGDHITLGQLLKVAGVIATGGEAKRYLTNHVPQVNGEPEQRRGRKLVPGDVILLSGLAPIRLTAGAFAGSPAPDAGENTP